MAVSAKFPLQTSHAKFLIAFPALLYAVCNSLNVDKLAKWFSGPNGLDYVALSAYLLAGLCLFIVLFSVLAHRWTIKPLAILLTLLSAAATYFISKYNVAIDSSMVLNAIHTDSTEVAQLLSTQMIPYVIFLFVVPAIVILSTEITFEGSGRYLLASARVAAVALLVAFGLLFANFRTIHRVANVSNKYIVYSLVPINYISGTTSLISKSLQAHLTPDENDVVISGRVSSQDNLMVVLAIGESARRKNFSVYGYHRRNTTPALEKTKGLHLLNGIAKRGSTIYALPEILEKNDVKLTTIVSKLGISTSCYVNYTLYDNCASVGETKVHGCRGPKCFDEDVIPLLEKNLETYVSGHRLVVLHLGGGSHGPRYADRHPPEFKKFAPTCNDADVASQCTTEQLYNSYDNTILYADYVLSEVIQKLDRSGVPYVFIYLSDHGESLMEEGRMFHGMPPGVPLPEEQSQIPLIVKASVPISIVKRDKYLQQDVFDTILDLLCIETPMFTADKGFIRKFPEPVPRTGPAPRI